MTWGEFREARPDLAEAGRALLYQVGVGLGFLATVRKDGGPRLHPMCPILTDDALDALLIPSLKREDLVRDGRYALHSFPTDDNEDAFYITGKARPVDAPAAGAVVAQFLAERAPFGMTEADLHDDQGLFELLIESVLLTRTTGHGDPSPQHTVWHAP